MSFLELCEEYFQTKDLYEIFPVHKEATKNELKRAYHKASLKIHPDRVEESEKELATKKFQTLGKAYSILTDDEKRKLYDECGDVGDDDMEFDSDCDSWIDYWRKLFKVVTIEDIKNFEKNYKDSEEELEDLKKAYEDSKGNMTYIIDNVLCANVEDEERFTKIILNLIDEGELKPYKKFTNESKVKKEKRKKRAENEAKEAEEWSKKIGLDKQGGLEQMILQNAKNRQASSDSFFDQLAAKYGGNNQKKKKAKK